MGRLRGAILCLAVAALAAVGCLPNRAAVSPDGKTFYFSLSDEGGFECNESSRIYALNIETGRLAAMTEDSRPAAWCALSSDGRLLAYMTGLEDTDQALFMMRTDTGVFWPLTGILQKHVQPWMIPGATPRLLAMSHASSLQPPRWAAYTPNEMPLPLPADAAAGFGNVGLAENRCAVTVYLPGPAPAEGQEEHKGAAAVYVINFPAAAEPAADAIPEMMEPPAAKPAAAPAKTDKGGGLKIEMVPDKTGAVTFNVAGDGTLTGTGTFKLEVAPAKTDTAPAKTGAAPAKTDTASAKAEPIALPKNAPTAVRVATWTELKDNEPIIDLAFSPDGKRLVAAMLGCGAQDDEACFVELDPAGKQPPKPLFDMYKGYYPQFTPDSKGLVYLRTTRENDKFREVVLWRFDGKPAVVLARLPGELGKAYTTWYWLPDGRLRIYHISEEGVRLVETAVDGQGAKARLLAHERLKAERHLADVAYTIGQQEKLPRDTAAEWDKAYAAQMKAADAAVAIAEKPAEAAFEAAWKAVVRWEDVPAVGPIPTPVPEITVPGTLPEGTPAPTKTAPTPTAPSSAAPSPTAPPVSGPKP